MILTERLGQGPHGDSGLPGPVGEKVLTKQTHYVFRSPLWNTVNVFFLNKQGSKGDAGPPGPPGPMGPVIEGPQVGGL